MGVVSRLPIILLACCIKRHVKTVEVFLDIKNLQMVDSKFVILGKFVKIQQSRLAEIIYC
jgi:hypothetical protein